MLSASSTPSPSPSRLPAAPESAPASRRGSVASRGSGGIGVLSPTISPRTLLRPQMSRVTTQTLSAAGALMSGELGLTTAPVPVPAEPDPFQEGATITINQPVGSLSISPSSRDVCLASRKGLYILDLANLESAPRFVPQGGTWQIADVQWSPHAATDSLILSTSSQKLLVWDLAANVALHRSIDAHDRAITDINWHPLNPNLMATVGMDAAVRGWDLRTDCVRPSARLSAWGAAGTQVKWNRKNEHVLATAHHQEVLIWDTRKGSVPVVVLKAHDSKIYGIDWDRYEQHKLVTCSLDKRITFWSIPELSGGADQEDEPYPMETITTEYPVWRARNLPFGHGVLALPQRGETALEMFGHGGQPIERFEGSAGVVKEFVWRIRGGLDMEHEDRDFQLVTWSKDRKLRIWPVPKETMERAGYKAGSPLPYLSSRRGAKDRSFTAIPGQEGGGRALAPLPAGAIDHSLSAISTLAPVGPSGIARQRLLAHHHPHHETGMTRGGGKARKIDQLDWLTRIVKTGPGASTDSAPGTRTPSVSGGDSSQSGSRSRSHSMVRDMRPLSHNNRSARTPSVLRVDLDAASSTTELIPLKDEVLLIRKRFPKSKVNFEKLDFHQRKLTMSLNGPWANGDRYAFIRIHWAFPVNYPYGPEIPTFELEKNATISTITRHRMTSTIKEMRAANRQCLVGVTEFLLGYHERTGRRVIDEESGSDSDDVVVLQNVPMLIRTTGAVFGPNGQLVCFFPKQTILPRARTSLSRSPSGMQDSLTSPLTKAITALNRLENPNKPVSVRLRRHVRRLKAMLAPVQQRSMLTLYNVSGIVNEPDMSLAVAYTTTSIEMNLVAALDAKRLDHAEVWATLRALLADPPPPYGDHQELHREITARRERLAWERDMERKRRVLDELFDRLMEAADVQLLALVACILLEYERTTPAPPPVEFLVQRSPEQGYFVLPPQNQSEAPVPIRRRSSITPPTPQSTGGPSSFRTSGWSQILMNPSSISLRGMALTPRDRSSFDVPPRTPIAGSFEDSVSSPQRGMNIPRQDSAASIGLSSSVTASPRRQRDSTASVTFDRRESREAARTINRDRPRPGSSQYNWSPPNTAAPATPSRLQEPTSEGAVRHKVSFGSASPLRRAFSRAPTLQPPPLKRRTKACAVRIDLLPDEDTPQSLIRRELLPLAEVWKLAYADFLFRAGLVGKRAAILQYDFCPVEGTAASAASGELPGQALAFASLCRFCQAQVVLPDQPTCAACKRPNAPPVCSVCRLPIKGLATTCTICSHTSHTRCLRAILTAPADHCPACPCQCLGDRGVSGTFMTAPPSPPPSFGGFVPMSGSVLGLSPTRLQFDGPHVAMSGYGASPSPPKVTWGGWDDGREIARPGSARLSPRDGPWDTNMGATLKAHRDGKKAERRGRSVSRTRETGVHQRRQTFSGGVDFEDEEAKRQKEQKETEEREREERERDQPLREGLLARARIRKLNTEAMFGW